MELTTAIETAKNAVHTQTSDNLFNRPAYEQCKSMDDAKTRAREMRESCQELTVQGTDVQFEVGTTGKIFVKVNGEILDPTNYFMNQVAAVTNVSTKLQEKLNPETLKAALNETWELEGPKNLLIKDEAKIRGMVGPRYQRLWDDDVITMMDRWLTPKGWVPAHPTSDTIPWVSKSIEEASLPAFFIGDRSSHFFMFTNDDRDEGGNRPGITVNNSEVGQRSFDFSTFLFRGMCCNFLIWEPKAVRQFRYRHTKGGIDQGWQHFQKELRELTNDIQPAFLEALQRSKGILLTKPVDKADPKFTKRAERNNEDPILTTRKEKLVKGLTNKTSLTTAQARRGVDAAFLSHNNEDGKVDPFSAFSVINGITDAAKDETYQDNMVGMVKAGSSLLDLALV